jgi:CheY-like chemotaxis protein
MDEPLEILLVEDQDTDLRLHLHVLNQQLAIKNQVHIARDGEEALRMVLSESGAEVPLWQRLKLVLMDLNIPTVDGFGVLRALRDDPRAASIPVIVLTGSTQDPDIKRSRELGARGYIVKPIDVEKLVEATRALGFRWLLAN